MIHLAKEVLPKKTPTDLWAIRISIYILRDTSKDDKLKALTNQPQKRRKSFSVGELSKG